ncbi:MAG: succinylglutamate desuccinylase/aspartoacylase family protein [Gammaproteobacteria bacterium]|nr:succinylglutamate desuccinylase/aspartoacylase family protein [Gammaproteobacteria bacterium]MCP5136331.1 succinylglutamate desuccinylase/aspartoacylase family protein [Gammaproteobacteria bacterium]
MSEALSLRVSDTVPEGLLEARAADLADRLGGPTLIHLPGRRPEPLFVSALLHGNEDTGFEAVKQLLLKHRDRVLPRALSILIGNVSAAKHGLRRLDGQPDYNRVWPGGAHGSTPEAALMAEVMTQMRDRKVFAAIDVHNNTGLNPHYACVNRLDGRFFHLATLFSRTVVYFIRPQGVASIAMAALCPSVTVECGQPGAPGGVEHAFEYLDAALHLAEHPDHPMAEHDMDLFHTVATVKIPEATSFHFDSLRGDADLALQSDLDHMNFRELPEGVSFGRVRGGAASVIEAWDEQGAEVGARYFTVADGELRTVRRVMPSMLTLDERVIRQDCLCYLMERVPSAQWDSV